MLDPSRSVFKLFVGLHFSVTLVVNLMSNHTEMRSAEIKMSMNQPRRSVQRQVFKPLEEGGVVW